MYAAINYVNSYLIGKGFESVSSDYRYWYYTDDAELQDALAEMPRWYLYLTAPLWA